MKAKKFSGVTLLSVTIHCGERLATFFINPALAEVIPFYYLNHFDVIKQLSLLRITTEKVKTDHSVATLGKNSRFYDVTTSKKYEVESAPLTSDECLQVKQLFTLPTVRIPFDIYSVLYGTNFDALTTILITDFTSEISGTNEKLNTVKFTLRFAVNRPKVNIPTSPAYF